jgi:hypothetical protein
MARSKIKTYALLVLAILLFAGLAWSLNLTAFNVWVAGGPPVQHTEIYEHRANIFSDYGRQPNVIGNARFEIKHNTSTGRPLEPVTLPQSLSSLIGGTLSG